MHETDIPGGSCQFIHTDLNAVDALAVGHETTNTILDKAVSDHRPRNHE